MSYSPDLDTWIVSDTHFFHDNLIKLTMRDKDTLPKFLKAWFELIQPSDKVLHLGDIFMGKGSKPQADELLPTLPGEKYFLRGNHDKATRTWYANHGFEEVGKNSRLYFPWKKPVLLSHYPDCVNLDWSINVHGHIHDGGYAPGTPDRDYRNVSLEVVGRPVRLREVLEGDMYQSRKDAPKWPPSKIYELNMQGRLTEDFCEIERNH